MRDKGGRRYAGLSQDCRLRQDEGISASLNLIICSVFFSDSAHACWNIFQPYLLTSSRTLLSPVTLAAVCALRSPFLSIGVRDFDVRLVTAPSTNRFFRITYTGSITTPSSKRLLASMEMLPATFLPTSAL